MAWAANFDDFDHVRDLSAIGLVDSGRGRSAQPVISHFGSGDKFHVDDEESPVTTIANLFPGLPSVRVIGVVIVASEVRHFPSKKDPNIERYVLSFTLRDSPNDFINVSCWGSEQYVVSLASQIHIGLVVDVINACVQSKPVDGSDDKFKPWTPGQHQLSVNESRGFVRPYSECNAADYLQLLHCPVKLHNDYYTIGDVMTNGKAINGDIISVMAVVKRVGAVRDMKSKNGRTMRKCEVKLFDDTASDFTLVLWDEELINLAQSWEPKENVIFAADVRSTFDEFRKTMVASAIAKTVLTVNPNTKEALSLYQYAQTVDLADIDCSEEVTSANTCQDVDLSQISKVYKMSEIAAEMSCQKLLDPDEPAPSLFGITYALLTSLDLDSPSASCLVKRCMKCKRRVTNANAVCSNENCSAAMPRPSFIPAESLLEISFDMRVALSDHTGTVTHCVLAGPVAEKMIGLTVQDFVRLPETKKTELKWKYLLERCKVYFQITAPHTISERSFPTAVRILDCALANGDEAARFA